MNRVILTVLVIIAGITGEIALIFAFQAQFLNLDGVDPLSAGASDAFRQAYYWIVAIQLLLVTLPPITILISILLWVGPIWRLIYGLFSRLKAS